MEVKAFYAAIALATMVGAYCIGARSSMGLWRSRHGHHDDDDGEPEGDGEFVITGPLRFVGWLATGVMAAAVLGMAVTAMH